MRDSQAAMGMGCVRVEERVMAAFGGLVQAPACFEAQNTASAGFQSDTNLNIICSLVPGKVVSVALSSSANWAAN